MVMIVTYIVNHVVTFAMICGNSIGVYVVMCIPKNVPIMTQYIVLKNVGSSTVMCN